MIFCIFLNVLDIPNENPSDIEYGLKGDNYTLHFEFKKVFPEPVCRIPLKVIICIY